jgi:hypothetical protein
MNLLKIKFWPLYLALIFLGMMALFSFTPLAWEWSGREDQSYPELFFALYGLPCALWISAMAVFIAILDFNVLSWSNRLARSFQFSCALGVLVLAIHILWLGLGNESIGWIVFCGNWLVLVAILLSGFMLLRSRRKL